MVDGDCIAWRVPALRRPIPRYGGNVPVGSVVDVVIGATDTSAVQGHGADTDGSEHLHKDHHAALFDGNLGSIFSSSSTRPQVWVEPAVYRTVCTRYLASEPCVFLENAPP